MYTPKSQSHQSVFFTALLLSLLQQAPLISAEEEGSRKKEVSLQK